MADSNSNAGPSFGQDYGDEERRAALLIQKRYRGHADRAKVTKMKMYVQIPNSRTEPISVIEKRDGMI